MALSKNLPTSDMLPEVFRAAGIKGVNVEMVGLLSATSQTNELLTTPWS